MVQIEWPYGGVRIVVTLENILVVDEALAAAIRELQVERIRRARGVL